MRAAVWGVLSAGAASLRHTGYGVETTSAVAAALAFSMLAASVRVSTPRAAVLHEQA